MCTWPVVIMVSTATRLRGSWSSIASRMESLIWSAILSGWPSVTDSEVKRRRGTRYSLGTVEVRWEPRCGAPVATTLPAGDCRWCYRPDLAPRYEAGDRWGATVVQIPAATASLLPDGSSVTDPSAVS